MLVVSIPSQKLIAAEKISPASPKPYGWFVPVDMLVP
jgi:hypothetical protein